MSSWNTIESDAGVFTELVEKLGVTGVEFEELLSIDADSLRAIGKLYGAIFLFKYRASEFERTRSSGGPLDGEYSTADPTVFFAQQTIQNACATQAVLSILLNRPDLALGDTLADFKEFVDSCGQDAELKGDMISNHDVIREVHNSFSRPSPFVDESDDRPHDEDSDGLYHFIAYVPVNGVLYELDGLHTSPISHGPCSDAEFPAKLSDVLMRRVQRGPEGEMRFNLVALTQDKREVYRNLGDSEGLAREEAKRAEWARENILRRENFVGLIYDLIKSTAANMSSQEFENKLQAARQESRRRIQQYQKQKASAT